MFRIIERYLIIEIAKSSIATTLILFIILMSNMMGRLLSDVSEGSTSIQALFPLLMGQSIYILSMLLPLGFFLGVVFAFGRLYKDHELVVLQACGIGYPALYSAVLKSMLPVLLLATWFSIWLSADWLQRAKMIEDQEKNVHQFQQLFARFSNSTADLSLLFRRPPHG